MPTPGLLYALTKPRDGFPEADFNRWYSEFHIQDVVKCGMGDLAIRYKNTNPDAKWPYLAIYRVLDMAKLQDQSVRGSLTTKHELIPEGKTMYEVMDLELRPCILVQKYEGLVESSGPRGKALRTVWVEPGEGADDEFDEWYRKQHLDMLSMVPGFRRSTRYKLADEAAVLGAPRYVALHEYDEPTFPAERVKLVTGTEWSKKVLGEAKKFEGDLWEQIAVHGATDTKF